MIQQVTIIGTGLIGGSLGLALKGHGFEGRIVGCDRPEVLEKAQRLQAIDAAEPDPVKSVTASQVVVLATPVMAILDILSRIAPALAPDALVTDTGSTKAQIAAHAQTIFGPDTAKRFLPSHPMAGKEHSGIENASADLFKNATWALTPPDGVRAMVSPEFTRGLHGEWMQWLEKLGSKLVVLEPEKHDLICAYTSHLPQMLSTALASAIADALGNEHALPALVGPGLRDMTRLSASDYAMWRDIALTNTKNLHDALLQLEQKLAHIRENLKTRELAAEFDNAHRLDLNTPAEARAEAENDTEPPKFW